MSKGKKIALGIIIVIVVVVSALAIAIPLLIDIDRYRPRVIAQIQEATGKPAEIGKLSLTVLPTLSIRVDNFALGNPTGFPEGHLVKAERIFAVVDGRALLDRRVVIKSLEIDRPVIRLLSDARGTWNFENAPDTKKAKPASTEPASFTLGVIPKVTVADGDIEAANLSPSRRPEPNFFEGRSISIDLEDVDINAFIGETAAFMPPDRTAAPRLASRAFGPTLAYAASPAGKPAAQGTLRANSLSFGSYKATSVKTRLRLFPKRVYFDDLNFDLYGGHASGAISCDFSGQSPRYATNARISRVDVAKLLEAFPDGRGKMTGKMDGQLRLTGVVTQSADPLAGMRGTGQLGIKDGQLPTLQLNKNLMTLAKLADFGAAAGDPSSFQSIAANLNIADGRINSDKISVIGSGVDIDGAGSISLAGAGSLAYEGIAKLAAGQNPLTNILGGLSGATYADGKLTFPFSIGGTLENPQFRLKSLGSKQHITGLQTLLGGQPQSTAEEGQTQQQQQTPADVVQGLSGLFRKKQTTQQQPTQPK